jgi:hypothetical protein
MVSKTYIKSLELADIEAYFNYILESEINGQRSQVHSLVDLLCKSQKKAFIAYLNENHSGTDVEIVKNIVITSF